MENAGIFHELQMAYKTIDEEHTVVFFSRLDFIPRSGTIENMYCAKSGVVCNMKSGGIHYPNIPGEDIFPNAEECWRAILGLSILLKDRYDNAQGVANA